MKRIILFGAGLAVVLLLVTGMWMNMVSKEEEIKTTETMETIETTETTETTTSTEDTNPRNSILLTGDECFDEYLPILEGKKVALFTNQTGLLSDGTHIFDALIARNVDVELVFAPEHGFRGNADAGASVHNDVDEKTNVEIRSLYSGGMREPQRTDMERFDILIVDIQDVGLRYYTYYITMYHLMEACAKWEKEILVLDRPNPNGFYVDGPILKDGFYSGVGALPIPVVHGLTLGEMALMINGEGWISCGKNALKLQVILCKNYKHSDQYEVMVNPSPNLKSMRAIYLYSSLCFFENTVISVGRGTDNPFTRYGCPAFAGLSGSEDSPYRDEFIPQSMEGAGNPVYLGQKCFGRDLSEKDLEEILKEQIHLEYVMEAYQDWNNLSTQDTGGRNFFGNADASGRYYFDLLMGTDEVRKMIEVGATAKEIKESWQYELEEYKKMRQKYLLYEE